jgi:hypothetical protein
MSTNGVVNASCNKKQESFVHILLKYYFSRDKPSIITFILVGSSKKKSFKKNRKIMGPR